MQVKEEIKKALGEALKEHGIEDVKVVIDEPGEMGHGDYTSNIVLIAFKKYQVSSIKYQVYKTALELAKAVVEILNTKYKIQNTEKIEAVQPGFINFWLSKDFLVSQLEQVLKWDEKQVLTAKLKNTRITVEFTDPNPFKEFHIGHLYSNVVGEALSRLFEACGATLRRVNYQGDVGLHVAKAIWGIFRLCHAELGSASTEILKQVQDDSMEERIKFLGEAYVQGAKAYEEDEKAKEEINKLNKQVYEKDPAIWEIYEKGKKWSLEYFEEVYKRLGTKFDGYYFESEVGEIGLKLVKEYVGKGVFEESEGAIIFPGKKYGLHNRVFVNSLGLPTYEAKELGLAPKKYKDWPYDQSIIITGNEINEYFKVLLKALSLIHPDLASKTIHIGHGMVRLATGKMSSRTGQVISGEWLLDEIKGKIRDTFPEIDDAVGEKVAVGAVKYALLRSGIGKDIAFSFEESISLEGNSGPYVQYTFARTQSVLDKAYGISHIAYGKDNNDKRLAISHKLEIEELSLLRLLHRFPEVVEKAAGEFAPNLLTNYLFELAQAFNLFYQKHKIIGSENEYFRLALTGGVGQTLKHGLYLLGIEAPQRM